jgi:hypothetical protein
MNTQNKQNFFDNEHSDDYNVLNYLLEHVRGLSPSSLTPEFAFDDTTEIE